MNVAKVILLILFLLFTVISNAYSESLDNTKWFDCLSRDECLKRGERLLLKNDEASRVAGFLSLISAEFLKQKSEPLDLNLLGRVKSEIGKISNLELKNILSSAVKILFNESAVFVQSYSDANSDSIDVLNCMILFRNSSGSEKLSLCSDVEAPFILFFVAEKYADRGADSQAVKLLKGLLKGKRRSDPDTVYLWSKVKMDSGKYVRGVNRRLNRSFKENPGNLYIKSQLIRYLRHKKKFNEVDKIIEEIDFTDIKGEGGYRYLLEAAIYYDQIDRLRDAEILLKKAIILEPARARSFELMGKLYLKLGDLPKAVASFKNYLVYSSNSFHAKKIAILLDKLESEMIYD